MRKDIAASVRARLFHTLVCHAPSPYADLLGFGPSDLKSIAKTFRDIASVQVADGIVFDHSSIGVEEIRKDASYAGARVLITGELARARCTTHIDIGFGDAVTPGPIEAEYPVLLSDLRFETGCAHLT